MNIEEEKIRESTNKSILRKGNRKKSYVKKKVSFDKLPPKHTSTSIRGTRKWHKQLYPYDKQPYYAMKNKKYQYYINIKLPKISKFEQKKIIRNLQWQKKSKTLKKWKGNEKELTLKYYVKCLKKFKMTEQALAFTEFIKPNLPKQLSIKKIKKFHEKIIKYYQNQSASLPHKSDFIHTVCIWMQNEGKPHDPLPLGLQQTINVLYGDNRECGELAVTYLQNVVWNKHRELVIGFKSTNEQILHNNFHNVLTQFRWHWG